MYELPLFPLNTVLFPGTLLRLHIFEERYKRMISACLADESPFGVVLIRRGQEALGALAEPYFIGCTAKIVQSQPLNDGRMNITALGQERFRVLTLDQKSQPYLVGYVQPYPVKDPGEFVTSEAHHRLHAWVARYFKTLAATGKVEFAPHELSDDPIGLAYMAAGVVQLPPVQKQRILSISDALALVEEMISLYRQEVTLLKVLLQQGGREQGSFSIN